MYIYTPLCRYWIALYRYVLFFIVPHLYIELEDNKQFISNIPRISATIVFYWLETIFIDLAIVNCHCHQLFEEYKGIMYPG